MTPHSDVESATSPPEGEGSAHVIELDGAELSFDPRKQPLWSGLNLTVDAGEFVAVLGGNGSGKTSLLRCLLGLQPLTAGSVRVGGRSPRAARRWVGYVPQQRRVDPLAPLRARDLVGFGVDGDRWGIPIGFLSRLVGRDDPRRARIEAALAGVDAGRHADQAVALLSGGEQQLIRVAQAVASDPALLLCDEPLLSLDLNRQKMITGLINRRRTEHGTAVVFVTHEINPVLPYVDRVVYLAGGRFSIGTVDEVLTSQTLSALYRTPIDVFHSHGRIIVAGAPDLHNSLIEAHASPHAADV